MVDQLQTSGGAIPTKAGVIPSGTDATCCCVGCEFANDDFDRANDTNIDTGSSAGWTEVSGAWSISSNKLTNTSAGIALCDTLHPDGNSYASVAVDLNHATSGSSCDVLVAVVDSSNYYYVRFRFGSNQVLICKMSGGSPTTLATGSVTLSTATTYSATVCVASGRISAEINSLKITYGSLTLTGDGVGLGTTGTGTGTFDNFVVTKSATADPACTVCNLPVCGNCPDAGGYGPEQVQVDISGFTNDTGTGCPSLDGTYVLPFTVDVGGCNYEYRLPSPVTSRNYDVLRAYIQLMNGASANVVLEIADVYGGGGAIIIYQYNFGASTDCLTFNSGSMTATFNDTTACNEGSPTITVQAL